ncbi:MAG: rhodanese-like domain-containing protein [bacterium]
MNQLRQAIQEAGILAIAAVVVALLYSLATEKGIFASTSVGTTFSNPVANLASITVEEAKALFDGDAALFIDSRHEFDFKFGHIKGAYNIPLKEFDKKVDTLRSVPKDKALIAYCDGAECNSSIEVAARLMNAGYTNIHIFFGGWQLWEQQKLPVASLR